MVDADRLGTDHRLDLVPDRARLLGRHAWTESVRPAANGCVISTVSGCRLTVSRAKSVWHFSDIPPVPTNVRYWVQSGHDANGLLGRLMTRSGHPNLASIFVNFLALRPILMSPLPISCRATV